MTVQEFCKGMKDHFGISAGNEYLDELFLAKKEVSLDIFKLNDWLYEKFPEYEGIECSMADLIEAEFSQEAVDFCHKAIE